MCRYALLVCVVQAYTQHRTGLRKGLTLWRKDRYWKHGAAVPASLQKSLHRCTPRHAGIHPNRKTHFDNSHALVGQKYENVLAHDGNIYL